MKWFYTEGKLNVSHEKQEKKFLLKDLVLETAKRNSLIKKIKVVFFILFISLCILIFPFAAFPKEESFFFFIFFSIGFISTLLFISAILSFFIFIVLKNKRVEDKELNKIFKSSSP